MTTKAKFICNTIATEKYSGGETTKIKLNAVTAYNSPEDKPFWDATTAGFIELNVVNEKAIKLFSPGKKFIVTFTEDTD